MNCLFHQMMNFRDARGHYLLICKLPVGDSNCLFRQMTNFRDVLAHYFLICKLQVRDSNCLFRQMMNFKDVLEHHFLICKLQIGDSNCLLRQKMNFRDVLEHFLNYFSVLEYLLHMWNLGANNLKAVSQWFHGREASNMSNTETWGQCGGGLQRLMGQCGWEFQS